MLIGIDPDTKKSGFCMYEKRKIVALDNLMFFDLFNTLYNHKDEIKKVILEAGWLNKGNWHISEKTKVKYGTSIGNKTGANHETGRKIEEMLQFLKIPYELKRPSTKKVDSVYFKKLTGIEKSNQDQRDAAMLVWGL